LSPEVSVEELEKRTGAMREDIVSFLHTLKRPVISPNRPDSLEGQVRARIFQVNRSWLRLNRWILIILFLLSTLIYVNALPNDFVSDDLPLISDPRLGSLSYVFNDPTVLLRTTYYAIVYHFFGASSSAFRAGNILFHAITVQLIFLFVWIMAGRKTAFISAVVFAVHPMFVEAITWISGGVYPQYSMFVLATLIAYLFGMRNRRFYVITLVLFISSFLVTFRSIVLPLLIVLLDSSLGLVKKHLKYYAGFIVISAVFGLLLLFHMQVRIEALNASYYIQSGIDNPLLIIPVALSNYFLLLLWPQHLTLYQTELTPSTITYIVEVFVTLGYFYSLWYFYKKNRTIFFFLSFFLISLLPFLTPFRFTWVVAERYVYLGSVGFIAAFSYGIIYASKKFPHYREIIFSLVTLAVIALSIRTFVRNRDWKNEDTLWVATIKESPSSPNAYNNIGDVYIRNGDFENAAKAFQRAIEIKPDYADAYHNLANTLHRVGKLDEAQEYYDRALSINPNLWQSHIQRADIFAQKKQFELVEQEINIANAISPNNPEILVSYAIFYVMTDNPEKAREYAQKTLQLQPDNKRAREVLRQIQ
jgi:tetratricopeptide (TPR) repeat protein